MTTDLADLLDSAALNALVSRYAHAVDARDIAGTVACFTEDSHVEFDGGTTVIDGRENLARFFETAFRGPLMGGSGASTHLMTDVIVEVTGDAAHIETQAVAYLASDERDTVLVRGLRYTDDCVRSDGGWLIGRRTHRAIWQAEAPGRPIVASPR